MKVAKPAIVAGRNQIGSKYVFLGHGTTSASSADWGTMRKGTATVADFSGLQAMTMAKPDESVIGWGDSGGPAYVDKKLRGRIAPILAALTSSFEGRRSYFTRLDTPAAQAFLKTTAQQYGIVICGINKACP